MIEQLKEIKNGGFLNVDVCQPGTDEFDIYDDILEERDFSTYEPNLFRVERVARALDRQNFKN